MHAFDTGANRRLGCYATPSGSDFLDGHVPAGRSVTTASCDSTSGDLVNFSLNRESHMRVFVKVHLQLIALPPEHTHVRCDACGARRYCCYVHASPVPSTPPSRSHNTRDMCERRFSSSQTWDIRPRIVVASKCRAAPRRPHDDTRYPPKLSGTIRHHEFQLTCGVTR